MDNASVMRICCMRRMEAKAVRSTKQNECLAKRDDFGINASFFMPGSCPETITFSKGTP